MIKQIENEFKKNGYNYRLVTRASTKALYEQFSKNGTIGYEAHKVRLKPTCTCKYNQLDGSVKEVIRPTREILANNEDFGTYGWSYSSYDNAMSKYNEL